MNKWVFSQQFQKEKENASRVESLLETKHLKEKDKKKNP